MFKMLKRKNGCVLGTVTVLLATGIIGCTGWDEDHTGVISLNREVFLNAPDGQKLSMPSGIVVAKFKYGVFGVSDPKLVIRGSESEVAIPISRHSITAGRVNASAQQLGQPFGIRAEKNISKVTSWEETHLEGCVTSGLCYHSHLKTDDDGNLRSESEFGFSTSCPGTHDVTREYVQLIEKVNAVFLNSDGEEIGTFTDAQGRTWVDNSKILSADECRI